MNSKADLLNSAHDKESAFLQRIQAHQGILLKICRTYQDSEEDRQDLYQEIVAQLWSSYDSFRNESLFSSWMYQVAFNTAIRFLKKFKKPAIQPYPDLPEDLQQIDDRKEQYLIFNRAIQRLDPVEKALIIMYLDDIPGKEIAEVLGLSAGNVRVRITRVKEKIKDIIKLMGYEF